MNFGFLCDKTISDLEDLGGVNRGSTGTSNAGIYGCDRCNNKVYYCGDDLVQATQFQKMGECVAVNVPRAIRKTT